MKIRHHHRNMETCEASQVAQWLRIRCQCRRCKRCRFDPWVGKMPWRRKWHPTPIFLPGTSHAQRSLVGYSPRGCKESDATERLSTQPHKNMWLLLLSHFSRVWFCATHRLQPTRLLCPWDSPGKNTGVGCHFLLQCLKVKSLSRVQLLATLE